MPLFRATAVNINLLRKSLLLKTALLTAQYKLCSVSYRNVCKQSVIGGNTPGLLDTETLINVALYCVTPRLLPRRWPQTKLGNLVSCSQ